MGESRELKSPLSISNVFDVATVKTEMQSCAVEISAVQCTKGTYAAQQIQNYMTFPVVETNHQKYLMKTVCSLIKLRFGWHDC